MSRFYSIGHKGREILVLKIDGCPSEEFESFLAETAVVIRKKSYDSLLVMALCGKEMPIPTDKVMFVEYLAMNAPHVKKSAIVGLPPMEKKLFTGIMSMAGRNMEFFDAEEEAMDFLAGF